MLRQLVTWLGWDTFLAGTNRYLTRHRFENAELADYLEALDSVTDRDVRAWAEAYLRTTGFDTILVTREGDVPVSRATGSRPTGSASPHSTATVTSTAAILDVGTTRCPRRPGRRGRAAERAGRGVRRGPPRRLLVARVVDDLSSLPDPLLRAVAGPTRSPGYAGPMPAPRLMSWCSGTSRPRPTRWCSTACCAGSPGGAPAVDGAGGPRCGRAGDRGGLHDGARGRRPDRGLAAMRGWR